MKIVLLKCTSIVAALLFLFFAPTQAQVKIGSAGNPNSNAVLELDGGTNKGLLLPRLSNTQITALATAPDGMIVYNTTDGFLYLRKTALWQKVTDATNTGGGVFSLPYTGAVTTSLPAFTISSTGVNSAIYGSSNEGIGIRGLSGTGQGGYFSSTSGAALVTAGGNVGIGTTFPDFPLDVDGRIRIQSNGELNSAGIWYDKMYTAGLSSFVGTMNDSSFGIYGGGDWKFTFDHINNRLGINQSNPKAPLSFSNGTGNKVDIYYSSENSRYGIGLQNALMQLYTGLATDDIAFGYGSSTAFTERMRIKGNGNVGIGTTNPTLGGLVVDKKAGAVNAIFGSNTTGVAIETDYPGIGLNTYYNNGRKIMNTGYGGLMGLDPTTGAFNFYNTAASVTGQGGAATLNARLTILANGDVGVGIAPTEKFEINTSTAQIGWKHSWAGGSLVSVAPSRLTPAAIRSNSAAVQLTTNTNVGLYIKTDGTIGAGTNTPTRQLDVNGRMRIRGAGANLLGSAGIFFDGTAGPDRAFFGIESNDKIGISGEGSGWSMSMNVNTGNGNFYNSVAIGTTAAPNSKLQVAGSVSMPYKRIDNANYTITDDDYTVKVFLSNGTGINTTVTLPGAAGRTGRIYVISANIPEVQVNPFDLTESKVTILDANGNNVIDGNNLTLSSPPKNYLANFSSRDVFSNISLNRIFKIKQTCITVQSDGTYWQIIANDFVAFRIDDFYD